jgi:hypothetical protein
MKAIICRSVCLLFIAGLTGSCASVDQYSSRAYDGNLNTQDAFNKEILANIIRASQYQALSWNPPSQITGSQMEQLTTGLPTITTGPQQMTPYQYSISNSLSSSVNGGFSTAPLATTSFQAGMLTPVDLKTIAALSTVYPREAIFYALIAAIDVQTEASPHQYDRLTNDPRDAYFDSQDSNNLSPIELSKCKKIIDSDSRELLFHEASRDKNHPYGRQCSYQKFRNLLSKLVDGGLYTELVQIPGQQPAQAQANQSNIVTIGRICLNRNYVGNIPGAILTIKDTNIPPCGLDRKQDAGGQIVTGKTETTKADDKVLNTNTKSLSTTITTTKTTILPITGRNFWINFAGIGRVDVTFEFRSPNGFLSYLGAWHNVGQSVPFRRWEGDKWLPYYDTIDAEQLFGDGPYLSVLSVNGLSTACYSSIIYEGQTYCVPLGAKHTSMLMDIAIMLRNLNITPADLNAPVSVRVTD